MPPPQGSDVHLDWFLSGILIAYMNEKEAYIADNLFPIQDVTRKSNKIAAYTKEDWFRDIAQPRSPGTETKGGGFGTARHQYFCENFGTHIDIPDEDYNDQDDPYDIERDATVLVGHRLMMRREVSWANDFFRTGVWTAPGSDTAVAAGDKWDVYATSDPIEAVFLGRDAIHSTTAREATDLIIGRQVWTQLRNHPDFLDRIKYTQTAIVTMDLVARLLDLDRIMVGNALHTRANEGAADPVFQYVFGRHALLLHVNRRPSRMMPTAGLTLVWSPLRIGGRRGRGGFPSNGYVRYLRDDKAAYNRVEGQTFYDQLAIGTDLGYLFPEVVAAA